MKCGFIDADDLVNNILNTQSHIFLPYACRSEMGPMHGLIFFYYNLRTLCFFLTCNLALHFSCSDDVSILKFMVEFPNEYVVQLL
jgi:hypothetical protein